MTAPSDLSVVIGLALLTTDRDPDEDAALARVIAVAGLGDLIPGTQGTPAVSSLTEPDDEDRCGWCHTVPSAGRCACLDSDGRLLPARYGVRP